MNKTAHKLQKLQDLFGYWKSRDIVIPPRAEPLKKLVCSEVLPLKCTYNPYSEIHQYCIKNYWQNGVTLFTPRGMSLSRALFKAGFGSDLISVFMRSFSTDTIHISVRPNDIIRMGTSKHFESCINYKTGIYRQALIWHLLNPDIGVCFVTDRSGEMKWRATLVATEEGIFHCHSHGTIYPPYFDWLVKKGIFSQEYPGRRGFSKVFHHVLRDTRHYSTFEVNYDEHKLKLIY